jgi:hypothetical protein
MVERSHRLAARRRAVNTIRTLGHHDLVGARGDTSAPAFQVGRRGFGTTPIDDDIEARVPPERDRQEFEELGVSARDHD